MMRLTQQLVTMIVVVALAVTAWAAPAKKPDTSPKDQAKAAFTAGNRHYQLNEYAAALEKFKDAFRLVPDPSFLFNIAQCQRLLGQKDEAVRSYRSFLRNVGETQMKDDVQAIIAQLEKEIADDRTKVAEAEAQRLKLEAEAREAERLRQANNGTGTPDSDKPKKPLLKQWWFWTAIGGAVVLIGVGAGLGAYYSRPTSADLTITSRHGLTIQF